MKKFAIAFIFASSLAAQVQLGKNVQIGATSGTGTVTQVDTDSTSGISGGPITGTGTVACEQGSATQFGCVKPDGTTITASGGVLTAIGGGSGGSLLPTGSSVWVGSVSSLYDDGDNNSRDLGVPTSVNCVSTTVTTCTTVFPTSHLLTAPKAAMDFHNLSSWPGGFQQGAQSGSLQVTSTPNGTTAVATTPNLFSYACSPCTGHMYDATNWGIWQFAFKDGILGVATIYGQVTSAQNAAVNVGTWIASMTGSPKFYADMTGANDLAAGRTVAQVNADHQTTWAGVHTAGAKVLQATMMPAQYGLIGVNILPMEVNYFEWLQSRGISAAMITSGQYVDLYSDTASAGIAALNASTLPTQTANEIFANTVARVLLTQTSDQGPPLMGTYSSSGLGADLIAHLNYETELFYDSNNINWMTWGQNAGGPLGIDLYSYSFTTGPPSMLRLWQTGLTAGNSWISDTVGRDSGNNNCFYRSFHYTGAGSTSNYLAFGPCGGSDGLRLLGTGALQLPALVASSGTQPLVVDTAGNVSVGTGGSGDVTGPASATADDVATFNGTTGKIIKDSGIASTNIVTAVTPSSPITASITGHTLSVACPTCGTGTGGTNVSQNSGAAETNLPITGFMPQFCSDTSASGTAQVCNTANTFTPQTGNTIVYSTTTTNGGTGLTVNVNSLGAKSVAVPGASGWTTTLTASQIPANKPLILSYDGTNWNVQQTGTVSASGGSGAWTNISGTIMPTNMTCTSTACTASAASTITFGSIPATGTEIVIKYNYASSSAVALRCQLNGDTGSNYAHEGVEVGSGGTTILSATSSTFMFCGAASVLSTSGTVTIPFYAVTSRPRAMLFQDIGFASVSSSTSNFHDSLGGLWNNTAAAVSSVTIFPASGTITGSFAIYLVN